MNADTPPPSWALVVPVKPPAHGKSRLVATSDEQRRELAEAFALDTVAAAVAAPGVVGVLVVTDDFRLAAALRDTGCAVVPDGVTEDLNATLVQGAAEAVRRWPEARPAALCADLPALRAPELGEVLELAADVVDGGGAAYVRDRVGTGTTFYAAPAEHFAPRFGVGSAEAHAAAGAVEVGMHAASVRADVDEVGDLGVAMVLGLGAHTSRASGRRATPQG
jgi:2-phospho-L-lactate/phosphoenolpyruvate guanylyltransferase